MGRLSHSREQKELDEHGSRLKEPGHIVWWLYADYVRLKLVIQILFEIPPYDFHLIGDRRDKQNSDPRIGRRVYDARGLRQNLFRRLVRLAGVWIGLIAYLFAVIIFVSPQYVTLARIIWSTSDVIPLMARLGMSMLVMFLPHFVWVIWAALMYLGMESLKPDLDRWAELQAELG